MTRGPRDLNATNKTNNIRRDLGQGKGCFRPVSLVVLDGVKERLTIRNKKIKIDK